MAELIVLASVQAAMMLATAAASSYVNYRNRRRLQEELNTAVRAGMPIDEVPAEYRHLINVDEDQEEAQPPPRSARSAPPPSPQPRPQQPPRRYASPSPAAPADMIYSASQFVPPSSAAMAAAYRLNAQQQAMPFSGQSYPLGVVANQQPIMGYNNNGFYSPYDMANAERYYMMAMPPPQPPAQQPVSFSTYPSTGSAALPPTSPQVAPSSPAISSVSFPSTPGSNAFRSPNLPPLSPTLNYQTIPLPAATAPQVMGHASAMMPSSAPVSPAAYPVQRIANYTVVRPEGSQALQRAGYTIVPAVAAQFEAKNGSNQLKVPASMNGMAGMTGVPSSAPLSGMRRLEVPSSLHATVYEMPLEPQPAQRWTVLPSPQQPQRMVPVGEMPSVVINPPNMPRTIQPSQPQHSIIQRQSSLQMLRSDPNIDQLAVPSSSTQAQQPAPPAMPPPPFVDTDHLRPPPFSEDSPLSQPGLPRTPPPPYREDS